MTSTPQPTLPLPGSVPLVRTRDDAPAYWNQDILWLILASAEDTGGRWSMMEELCPKGSGAPPHIHVWSDETFYVIEGELTFLINDEQRQVAAGSFIVIPRGTKHGFRVDSQSARILNQYTPASWETAVIALAEPALDRTIPLTGRSAPDRENAIEMMKAFGMQPVLGPDPLR